MQVSINLNTILLFVGIAMLAYLLQQNNTINSEEVNSTNLVGSINVSDSPYTYWPYYDDYYFPRKNYWDHNDYDHHRRHRTTETTTTNTTNNTTNNITNNTTNNTTEPTTTNVTDPEPATDPVTETFASVGF